MTGNINGEMVHLVTHFRSGKEGKFGGFLGVIMLEEMHNGYSLPSPSRRYNIK